MDDLRFLGLNWDEGPYYQSQHTSPYHDALQSLLQSANAYPCVCSRKEVEAASSAPHAEDGAAVYPGTCRGRFATVAAALSETGKPPAVRFAVPEGRVVKFFDAIKGETAYDVARDLGDFVIAKADGTPAYQLAVVVDDAAANVTDVIRGDDLLDSAPRQILLYEALGMTDRIPTYHHVPLVVGPDGRRLAKRHGDTRLSYYREQGVPAERILALLARWCGISNAGEETTADDLLRRFDVRAMSHAVTTFTSADDRWLLAGAGRTRSV